MTPEEWASVKAGNEIYRLSWGDKPIKYQVLRRTPKTLIVQREWGEMTLAERTHREGWFLSARDAYLAEASTYTRKAEVSEENVAWARKQAAKFAALAEAAE